MTGCIFKLFENIEASAENMLELIHGKWRNNKKEKGD